MMTPGQAAFEEWVNRLDRPYPITWNQMPDSGKAGWDEVALAAINQQTCFCDYPETHTIGEHNKWAETSDRFK